MNIKIMLNKDEEITRLAQDPEVQIKIKNAIVDAVAARTVKAIRTILEDQITRAASGAVFNNPDSYSRKLKPEVEKQIKKVVDDEISIKIIKIADGAFDGFDTRMREMLEKYERDFSRYDVEEMLQKAADRFFRERMSK